MTRRLITRGESHIEDSSKTCLVSKHSFATIVASFDQRCLRLCSSFEHLRYDAMICNWKTESDVTLWLASWLTDSRAMKVDMIFASNVIASVVQQLTKIVPQWWTVEQFDDSLWSLVSSPRLPNLILEGRTPCSNEKSDCCRRSFVWRFVNPFVYSRRLFFLRFSFILSLFS